MHDESDFVLYGAASLRTGSLTPAGAKISIGRHIYGMTIRSFNE